jgi:hypothetical protein
LTLVGTIQNELGLRKWLEDQGHTLVTTADKDGEESTFDKELVDAEVIITTPYVKPRNQPALLTLAASTLGISLPNVSQKLRISNLLSLQVLVQTMST